MAINSVHTSWLDVLMRYWTYLGDGVVVAVIVLMMLLLSIRKFFITGLAYIFGGLAAQVLKKGFFHDFPRPVKYFDIHNIDFNLYLIEGLHMHGNFSFPSGHTATAFAVFFCLACFIRRPLYQLLLFILALGVAYSRVYLSQHFLMDVVAGSLVGILMGWLSWMWIHKYNSGWLDESIQQIILRKIHSKNKSP